MLYLEGFEGWNPTNLAQALAMGWDNTFLTTTTGRDGIGVAASTSTAARIFAFYVNYNELYLGIAVKYVIGTANSNFLRLNTATTVQVSVSITSDGVLSIYRGTASLLESTIAGYISNGWHYIEIYIKIGANGAYTVKLDEAIALNDADANTQNHASISTVDNFGVGATTTIDDLYVTDTGFLGDNYIVTLFPNANGTTRDFSRSTGADDYALIDESTPSEADYLYSSTAGHIVTCELQNLVSDGAIKAIEVDAYIKKVDPGGRFAATAIRTNAINYFGDSTNLSNTSNYLKKSYLTLPYVPNDPFSVADVNALEAGVKLVS